MAGVRTAVGSAPRGFALVALVVSVALLAPHASAQDDGRAFFTLSPSTTSTGRTVTVDAGASEPSDQGTAIVEYAWRWSADEEFEVGNKTGNHTYSQAGIHVVTLRVTDDADFVAFANQTVLVRGSSPEANFFFQSIEKEDFGLRVIVNATFSRQSRGATAVEKYEWDFGEGAGWEEGNVTEERFFSSPGKRIIKLRVTDDEGRTDTTNEPVVVESTFLSRLYTVWQARATFVEGAKLTLYLAVVSTVIGFALSIVLALMRISNLRLVRWPAAWYIEIIRGTPLFVQILIAWLVLPQLGLKLGIVQAGLLALVVNTSAYQAEAIRGGIQAIPTGQMEAATSLGMTYFQAMRHVVLPQAFRLTLPPLGNEFIILLKDTSLVSVIGVVELTKAAQIFSARTFLVLEAYLGIALIYFVMTYSISISLRHLEKRLAIPGLGMGGTQQ